MPLDLALVSAYPSPGSSHSAVSGVGGYTVNLARALANEGVGVTVVAPDEPGAPPVSSDGEVMVRRSGARGPLALARSVRMAARLRPDVIHVQHELFLFGGISSLAALPLAVRQMRRFEGASFATVHQVIAGDDIDPQLMRLHRLRSSVLAARVAMNRYHDSMSSMGRTVVHEPAFSSQFLHALVIPHGVDKASPANRDSARKQVGLDGERRLVVLCFGFVAPYKGLESALAAAATVPDVLLVVAGGDHPRHGPGYTETLRSRWGHTARFTGWVSDDHVAAWHAAADLALFCYPAPHSSSGAVAVALGHDTPILVSDALAHSMDLPRELAVTIEPRALAGRLRRVADNRESLIELRRLSGGVALGRLWPDVARRHLQAYEEASTDMSAVMLPVGTDQLESV